MNTSYFAKTRFLTGQTKVAICTYVPVWYKGHVYEALAPTKEILKAYKAGKLSPERYTERYTDEVLSSLSAKRVYRQLVCSYGADCILLCYETPEFFCHRRVVASWFLSELGVKVPELTSEVLRKGKGLFK